MLPSRRPAEMPRFTRAALIFNPAARRMQAQRGRLLQRVFSGLAAEGFNVQVTPTLGRVTRHAWRGRRWRHVAR